MVSAIILAAGMSQRMGEQNKLLLPFRGKELFLHSVDAALNSIADECILVTGYESEKTIKALSNRKIKTVQNTNYSTGMTSSIQAGIENCDLQSKAYLICLSDMPFIFTEAINQLIIHWQMLEGNSILRAKCLGKISHPTLFSSAYKSEIIAHSEPKGCKAVIQKNQSKVQYLPFEVDFSIDIDDPKSYQKWR